MYKAHFKGGPNHGQVITIPSAPKMYNMTKVYDVSGFRTKSKYNLIKQEGDNLYYTLEEERFDGVDPTPFQRNPK
jgi:hypothetical protein